MDAKVIVLGIARVWEACIMPNPRRSTVRMIQCAAVIIACATIPARGETIYDRRMGDWSVSCYAEEHGFQGCEAQKVYKPQNLAERLRMGSDYLVFGMMINELTHQFEVRFKAPGWRFGKGEVHDVGIVFDDAIRWDIPMDTVDDGQTFYLRYSGSPDSEGALPGGFMSAQAFELIIGDHLYGSFPLAGSHAAILHASEKTEQLAGRTS